MVVWSTPVARIQISTDGPEWRRKGPARSSARGSPARQPPRCSAEGVLPGHGVQKLAPEEGYHERREGVADESSAAVLVHDQEVPTPLGVAGLKGVALREAVDELELLDAAAPLPASAHVRHEPGPLVVNRRTPMLVGFPGAQGEWRGLIGPQGSGAWASWQRKAA